MNIITPLYQIRCQDIQLLYKSFFSAALKDRIRRRKEKFGSEDSEHVIIDSLQDKKFYYSSSSR